MKRQNVIISFIFLTLVSCMPDSLTKFEEESTKIQKESSTSGGTSEEESVGHISKVFYNQAVGQKVILNLTSAANFVVDGYISAETDSSTSISGVSAKVNYIDGQKVYAEIETSTTTTFQKDVNVDNVNDYFSSETTVSDDIEYTFSLGENMGDSTYGFYPHFETTSTLNADDFTFSLSPGLGSFSSSGINFLSKGTCFLSTEFPACNSGCTAQTAYTTESSCSAAGRIWGVGGTIYGTPTTAVQSTNFTLTITDPNGSSTSTSFAMSLSESPKGLSYTRTVLLHVPSASAFSINDGISSSSGGEGTVLGTFSSTSGVANTEKASLLELDYIEVRVIKGTFKELDDLDNVSRYGAQKTYVLGDGVIPYTTKIKLLSDQNFKDPFYSSYIINENLIFFNDGSGTTGKARIKYFDKNRSGNGYFLYVSTTDEGLTVPTSGAVASKISEDDSIQTEVASTIVTGNSSIIYATNLMVVTNANVTNSSAGHDITSDNTTNTTAIINSSDTTTTTKSYNLTLHQGIIEKADRIDSKNPFNIAEARLVTAVNTDKTFYLFRGDEAVIMNAIDTKDTTDIKYSINTPLPPGLILDEDTGMISGTPTDSATIQDYVITASSPYGSTSYSFNIKVNDQIIIRNTTDSYSYIMHRGLRGKQRVNCRVTQDQIDAYAPGTSNEINNIHCFLDAGEQELHSKGVKIEVDIGADMCQHLVFSPYFTNQFKRGATIQGTNLSIDSSSSNKVAYYHKGDDANECPRPYDYTEDVAGTTPIGNQSILTQYASFSDSPKYLCDFDHSLRDQDFPNCDSGSILVREISYTALTAGGCSQEISDVIYECGGKQSACIKGPAKTIMGDESIDAGIFSKISNVSAQEAKLEFTFDAPLDNTPVPYSTNTTVANYMNVAGCITDSYKIESTFIDTYAKTLDMNPIGQQNPMTQTNPIYQFNCIDGAGETKAYINLYIRDWDQAFTASNNIDLVAPTSLMDVGGSVNSKNDLNNIFSSGDNICSGSGVTGVGSVWDVLSSGNNFLEDAL